MVSQTEYDNTHQMPIEPPPVLTPFTTPPPNSLVHLVLPTFAGDTVITETNRRMNLEIKQLNEEYKESRAHYFLNHKGKVRCPYCTYECINLLTHENLGPFAPQHQFSTLDKNLETELLLYSTLRQRGKELVGTWDTSVQIFPHQKHLVSTQDLCKLKAAAKNVPSNLSLAITSRAPIFVCGEHTSIFPSLLSLALHHVTTYHTYHTHVCRLCATIVNESFLTHYEKSHDKCIIPPKF